MSKKADKKKEKPKESEQEILKAFLNVAKESGVFSADEQVTATLSQMTAANKDIPRLTQTELASSKNVPLTNIELSIYDNIARWSQRLISSRTLLDDLSLFSSNLDTCLKAFLNVAKESGVFSADEQVTATLSQID